MKNNYSLKNKQLLCIGKHVRLEMIDTIDNDVVLNKPKGGLWTSILWKNKIYLSDWDAYRKELEDIDINCKCSLIQLKESAKIYTLHTYDHIYTMPYKAITMFRPEIEQEHIDFKALAKDYDVFYLTKEMTRMDRFGENSSTTSMNFYCWDVESVVILNPTCIKKITLTDYDTLKEQHV